MHQRRRMLLLLLASLLFTPQGGCRPEGAVYERSDAAAAIADCPPAPDFFEPVDYVAWLDEQYGRDKPAAWADAYSDFWKHGSADLGMPDAQRQVWTRLEELAGGPVWQRGAYPEVEAYLEEIRPHLEIFIRDVNKSGYRFRPTPDPQNPRNPMLLTLPWTASSKYAVYALLAESWRSDATRPAGMLAAWRIGLRHARHLEQSGQLILRGQGIVIRMAVCDAMRAAAFDELLDRDAVRAALALLEEYGFDHAGFADAVHCEWGGTLGFVQALYPNGRLDKQFAESIAFVDGGAGVSVTTSAIRAARITPAELAAAADEYFPKLVELARQPTTADLPTRVQQLERQNQSGRLAKHPLQACVQPPLSASFRQEFRCTASARATILILMILQHRHAAGAWPASLTEMGKAAGRLVDPGSGDAFVYQRATPAAARNGFLLYSIGEDGVDDGGKHAPWERRFEAVDGDFVFWPPQGRLKHNP